MAKRRTFTPEFKAKVVLEMLVEGKSMAQASREYGIKDTVLSRWKGELTMGGGGVKTHIVAGFVSLDFRKGCLRYWITPSCPGNALRPS
jgi:hypothetical protein